MQTNNLPARIPVPFANAGAKNTIPVASQIGITPGAASYTDGFPPATRTPIAAGGVPPYGVDFNGILNAITAQNQWENAGGHYPFDAAFAASIGGYPKGALLARVGYDGFWVSSVDNNSTNPDTGGAGWLPLFGVGGDYALDTGTANSYVVAFTPAVLSIADGMVVRFKAKTANSGASTFAPNSLAAKPIVGAAHAALQGGEIVPNGDVWLQWNSAIGAGSWVLVEATGGALQVGTATQSQHALNLGQLVATNTGTNDFVKIPVSIGGTLRTALIQWGFVNTSSSATLSVTLPTSYASAAYRVVSVANDQTVSNVVSAAPNTASTFNVSGWGAANTTVLGTRVATTVNWIAIGIL